MHSSPPVRHKVRTDGRGPKLLWWHIRTCYTGEAAYLQRKQPQCMSTLLTRTAQCGVPTDADMWYRGTGPHICGPGRRHVGFGRLPASGRLPFARAPPAGRSRKALLRLSLLRRLMLQLCHLLVLLQNCLVYDIGLGHRFPNLLFPLPARFF